MHIFLKNSLTIPQSIKLKVTIGPSNSPRYLPKRIENICPYTHTYKLVHKYSEKHYSQKSEWKQSKYLPTDK